nr:MAG TPA: transporter family protein [Bacteriophage sp.]
MIGLFYLIIGLFYLYVRRRYIDKDVYTFAYYVFVIASFLMMLTSIFFNIIRNVTR